ncbi:MAG: hypothetical protein ACLSGP_09565 [Faecalibacterium prausnitzii]
MALPIQPRQKRRDHDSYGASLYPSIRAVLNSDEALQQSIARLNGLKRAR